MTQLLCVLLQNMPLGRQNISPPHQYSESDVVEQVGKTGGACVSPNEEEKKGNERKFGKGPRGALLILCTGWFVLDKYKRAIWSQETRR